MKRQPACSAALVLAMMLVGCTSTPDPAQPAPHTMKPIDRVRDGVVTVSTDLKQTLASTEALANDNSARQRSALGKDRQTLEKDVADLRTDAAELRERASEYLMLWSGNTATVTSNSVTSGTDPRHGSTRDKYDQMVANLVAAKDLLLPLLDQLKQLENRSGQNLSVAEVKQISADGNRALANLDEALARLDELKAIVTSNSQRAQ